MTPPMTLTGSTIGRHATPIAHQATGDESPTLTVNLGPLTTTFTPPADCNDMKMYYFGHRNVEPIATLYNWCHGCQCGSGDRLSTASYCLPPLYGGPYNNLNGDFGTEIVYPVFSPGSVCPSGYGSSCLMTSSGAASRPGTLAGSSVSVIEWNSLASNEFAIGCCPSGFSCDEPYTCVSKPSVGGSVIAYPNDGCDVISTIETTETTLVISSSMSGTVFAAQIVLVQAEASSTTAQSTASDAPGDGTSSGDSSSGSGSLSTGAKAAIGTVVPLAVIIISLLVYALLRQRRKQQQNKHDTDEAKDPNTTGDASGVLAKAELDSSEAIKHGTPAMGGSELDATESYTRESYNRHSRGASATISELSVGTNDNRFSELPGSPGLVSQMGQPIAELPGDSEAEQVEQDKTLSAKHSESRPIKRRPVPEATSEAAGED